MVWCKVFLRLKDVTNTSKRSDTVQLYMAGILQYNGGKLEEAEGFNFVFPFVAYIIKIDQL